MIDSEAWGSELASWDALTFLLVAFGVVVVLLLVFGRGSALERVPDALERLTGLPGWAVATFGTAAFGLLVAGEGFYSDVWWHIALGRDKALMTAPHTSIVVGLGLIFLSSAVGIVAATATGVDTPLRWGALRVPWSTLPLAVLGASALGGFPLDELWHQQYGIDVTMWSPTHMLMILGATFTPLAAWLVLAEAGVSPRGSIPARLAHLVAAGLTILGLSAPQGEFEFGVPQFQQMFLPLLVTIVAGFTFVVVRLACGPGRALALGVVMAGARMGILGDRGELIDTRAGGVYILSALVVEVVALALGTGRRLRFAVASGVGVGTLGLAGEWWWNQGAHQPWTTNLLPDAVILSAAVGVGVALVGAAFAGVLAGEPPQVGRRLPTTAVALAGAAVLVALALPMPRPVGDVVADLTVEPSGDTGDIEWARLRVRLDPDDAAADARWFQAMSWQGGGMVIAAMERVGPGEFATERAVPVNGRWKTVLRLHRGGEMMAVPVYLPADPEIGEPEVPAEDRQVAFGPEQDFLLRETTDGDAWFAWVVHALLAGVAAAWVAVFVRASSRIRARAADVPRVAALGTLRRDGGAA